VVQAEQDLSVEAEVPHSYLTHLLLELLQVVLVALVISLQVEQELHQQPQTHLVQAEVAEDLSLLAVTHLVTQAVLAEMAEAEAEALTTLEHLVLAVTA
jgi:hypothetical protein